jgi:hypothetical protein
MIHMNFKSMMSCLLLLSLLVACSLTAAINSAPTTQAIPLQPTMISTSLPRPADTLMPTATPGPCLAAFQRQELKEPYQRDKYTNAARYTLSTEELNAYGSVMGIESLCIPAALGAPFLNVDWNSATLPAVKGQMISVGFEALYPGGGWSRGFLLYSTYDFGAPTEYEIFATPADWDMVRQGTGPDLIEVNGVKGLIRFKRGDLCYGACSAYKTFVFPFETYYVAVVYDLGAFDYNANWETLLQDFRAGKYPPELQTEVAAMDELVSTIHFRSPAKP